MNKHPWGKLYAIRIVITMDDKAVDMNTKRFAILTVMLMGLLSFELESSTLSGFKPGFNIRNLVKHTDLIVYGTVTHKAFVFRDNATHHQYTTDITVSVQQTIKGSPNAGKNVVKFMIEGGEGQDLIVKPPDVPDFEVGEPVLMFLSKSKRKEVNLPHDGYYVFYGQLGKMAVNGGKVSIPYTFNKAIVDNYEGRLINKKIDIREHIDLPIDLVIKIAKASLIDYDATVPLEAKIRSVISESRAEPVMTKGLVNQLTQTATQIIKKGKN